MIRFNYVKMLASYIKKSKSTFSLRDAYERYDNASKTEFKQALIDKRNRKHVIGYKIALIQIEKALIEVARKAGDIPLDMPYGEAKKAVLDNQYDYNKIAEIAEGYERAAIRDFEEMETRRKEDPKFYNEYRYLGLRRISNEAKVDEAYFELLDTIDSQAEEMLGDEEPEDDQIIALNSVFKNIIAAYDRVSGRLKKRRIDELILTPSNADQSSLYIPNNFADVTYIPHKAINQRKGRPGNLTIFTMQNSFGDNIEITRMAEVGFGRFRQPDGKITYRDYSTLGEYQIVKRYQDPVVAQERKSAIPVVRDGKVVTRGISRNTKRQDHYWDEDLCGEVFYVLGDLRERILFDESQDPLARRFTANVLLSNGNLDIALDKNGGYIGDMSFDKEKGRYVPAYDQDKLCVAKELDAIKYKHRLGDVPIQIDIETGRVHIGGETVSQARRPRDGGEYR